MWCLSVEVWKPSILTDKDMMEWEWPTYIIPTCPHIPWKGAITEKTPPPPPPMTTTWWFLFLSSKLALVSPFPFLNNLFWAHTKSSLSTWTPSHALSIFFMLFEAYFLSHYEEINTNVAWGRCLEMSLLWNVIIALGTETGKRLCIPVAFIATDKGCHLRCFSCETRQYCRNDLSHF